MSTSENPKVSTRFRCTLFYPCYRFEICKVQYKCTVYSVQCTVHNKELFAAPEEWRQIAKNELDKVLATKQVTKRPKNVIFFLGDGMGISTLTAARIYKGQLFNKSGEEGSLTFEQFPFTGLIKVTIMIDNYDHFGSSFLP